VRPPRSLVDLDLSARPSQKRRICGAFGSAPALETGRSWDGIVSEAQEMRDKASHARKLAWGVGDEKARAALEAMAVEFDQQATELEAEDQSGQDRPASRSDTP
jgi:hypothetical protein